MKIILTFNLTLCVLQLRPNRLIPFSLKIFLGLLHAMSTVFGIILRCYGRDGSIDMGIEAINVGLSLLYLWSNVVMIVWVQVRSGVRSSVEIGFADLRR